VDIVQSIGKRKRFILIVSLAAAAQVAFSISCREKNTRQKESFSWQIPCILTARTYFGQTKPDSWTILGEKMISTRSLPSPAKRYSWTGW